MSAGKYEEPEPEPRLAHAAHTLWPDEPYSLFNAKRFFSTDYRLARTFRGRGAYRYGYLLWLQQELEDEQRRDVCVFMSQTTHTGVKDIDPEDPSFHPIEPLILDFTKDKKGLLTGAAGIEQQLKSCMEGGARFVIGLVMIKWGGKMLGDAHDNALVIDFKKQAITRYEPNGGLVAEEVGWYAGEDFDEALRNLFFNDIFRKIGIDHQGWIVNTTNEMCAQPVQSTESRVDTFRLRDETAGYCAAWSMLFLHYRIMHPELSNKAAVREFCIKNSPEEMALMIRQYAAFIASLRSDLDYHYFRDE